LDVDVNNSANIWITFEGPFAVSVTVLLIFHMQDLQIIMGLYWRVTLGMAIYWKDFFIGKINVRCSTTRVLCSSPCVPSMYDINTDNDISFDDDRLKGL
jgi:hypothetical protein